MSSRRPCIAAIGTYIPPGRVSNAERAAEFDVAPSFLKNKIGVLERSIKEPSEAPSDLCVKAFEALTRKVDIDAESVRLTCVVTQNPDRKIPHTAAILHSKLGLAKHCMTFDVSQGCAGFTHGIALVTGLLDTSDLDDALLFTCDPYSTIVDSRDKGTALIFGDAASATLISRRRPGYAMTDSDYGTVPGSHSCLMHDGQRLNMDGRLVFSHAAREVPLSVERVLARRGLTSNDIDRFLLHPGSRYIIDFLRGALKVPPEKVPFPIEHYGNTVSSSIPILLEEHWVGAGSRVLASGFGVGFSWGTTLLEYRV